MNRLFHLFPASIKISYRKSSSCWYKYNTKSIRFSLIVFFFALLSVMLCINPPRPRRRTFFIWLLSEVCLRLFGIMCLFWRILGICCLFFDWFCYLPMVGLGNWMDQVGLFRDFLHIKIVATNGNTFILIISAGCSAPTILKTSSISNLTTANLPLCYQTHPKTKTVKSEQKPSKNN